MLLTLPSPRVQSRHDHLPTVHPHRWYTTAFGPVPLQLATMIAALLCSNSNHVTVTYRFGKAIIPKAYLTNLAKQSASEVPTLQKGLTDPNSCMTCTHSMSGSQFRRVVNGKLLCHCTDVDIEAGYFVARTAQNFGKGFYRCSRTDKDKCNFFAWSREPAVISTATTGTMSTDDNTTRDSTTPAHTSHYHDSQPVSTSPVRPGQSHSSSLVSMSREEMRAKISLLTAQLMEKEEEIRVAMRWKEEAEAKLEDIKDVLRSILDR
ncbi:hypothetical protein BS47DRAFT_1388617 [Hydnum rufescens UP504]|uniref:GRF-type domain-containing protein n=1 Tax=Hydnum rufescens UP504 TaxID=1448309 RepID=A0A9P6DXY5_9AGAM|nr:hypothetical protein BS47DRAFT_1388617 [Hydnum rufescens UP504]